MQVQGRAGLACSRRVVHSHAELVSHISVIKIDQLRRLLPKVQLDVETFGGSERYLLAKEVPVLLELLRNVAYTVSAALVVEHRRVRFQIGRQLRCEPEYAHATVNEVVQLDELRLHVLQLTLELLEAAEMAKVMGDLKLRHVEALGPSLQLLEPFAVMTAHVLLEQAQIHLHHVGCNEEARHVLFACCRVAPESARDALNYG